MTLNLSKISHLKVVIRTTPITSFWQEKTCFQSCQRQKSSSQWLQISSIFIWRKFLKLSQKITHSFIIYHIDKFSLNYLMSMQQCKLCWSDKVITNLSVDNLGQNLSLIKFVWRQKYCVECTRENGNFFRTLDLKICLRNNGGIDKGNLQGTYLRLSQL